MINKRRVASQKDAALLSKNIQRNNPHSIVIVFLCLSSEKIKIFREDEDYLQKQILSNDLAILLLLNNKNGKYMDKIEEFIAKNHYGTKTRDLWSLAKGNLDEDKKTSNKTLSKISSEGINKLTEIIANINIILNE